MKDRVVVTGANGHVGSNVVMTLLENGYSVRAGVRKFSDPKIWQFLADAGAEVVALDVLNQDQLTKALKDCVGVFHTAAPNLIYAHDPDAAIFRPIVEGTKNVVHASTELGIKKLIYTSSCSAIGIKAPGDRPLNENDWGSTRTPIFMSAKVMAERIAWQMVSKSKNLKLITVCPPAVIGPGFRRHTPATKNYEFLIRGWVPPLPRMGYHFVDVRDLAEFQRLVFENPKAEGRYITAGPYFNTESLRAFLKEFDPNLKVIPFSLPLWFLKTLAGCDAMASTLRPKRIRELTLELVHIIGETEQRLDSSKAKSLGWKTRDFSESLADTLTWIREHF